MTDIADIIARLEKLEGPDRALADEILIACGWVYDSNDEGEITEVFSPAGVMHNPLELPDPTASIDDALTLLPKDWDWALFSDSDEYRIELGDPEIGLEGIGPTAAIAICIAALRLKARQHQSALASRQRGPLK